MRIELGGAFADLLNEKGKGSGDNEMGYVERTLGFRTHDLEDRDLGLVTDIVGGTVRWRRFLDHLILSLCHDESTFTRMEPLLLQILRIGFYEIVKLEMPSYAVVDENVRLAKIALRPGAGNMVDGIFRKLVLLKETNSLPLPKLEGDDRAQARALATLYSHPVWMVRRWTKYLGREEAIKLMMWNNSDPHFSLRANRVRGFSRAELVSRLQSLKVSHELSPHLDDFVRIRTGMQAVIQAGLLKEGLCSVQDESAGLVVSIVDPQPGESIVDCCAAPGGKTLFMASCLSGQGMISAIDINKGQLRILRDTANTMLMASSPPCMPIFVYLLADLRWNRRLEDMEQLKVLQDELLDAASMLVKPGGVLVYSTCSIDVEENEERVAAFLQRHREFCIDSADRYVSPDFVTEHGFYSSNPVKHSLDGAFAARLVRSYLATRRCLVLPRGILDGTRTQSIEWLRHQSGVSYLRAARGTLFVLIGSERDNNYEFSSNKLFASCRELGVLDSFLHWNFYPASNTVEVAFRKIHTAADRWIAWAVNPTAKGMVGSQAFIAFQENGAMKAYTAPITSYGTKMETGNLSFPVFDVSAAFSGNEIIIFARFQLPANTTVVNHVWQEGPVIGGSTLGVHALSGGNVLSHATIDFYSGKVEAVRGFSSKSKLKVAHGILNAISWGTLMPLGMIFARHVKVFPSADPTWFYLHVCCQCLGYFLGVVGGIMGFFLRKHSSGMKFSTHGYIGATLLSLATLQVLGGFFLRPKKDHKYRLYWNLFHWGAGYATIGLGIYNVFVGLHLMNARTSKVAYTAVISTLLTIAVVLEILTCYMVRKRRKSEISEHASGETEGIDNAFAATREQQMV
ncbi:hypothetical protein RJ639_022610 [Escallonia herrerae]|uniref:Cytochrome b561 and DOMON domain-containing protein n=1 Tax=Escallonia herrerae TaxID=1293975 RepID=A0AA88UZW5_9ASTE|nr:hypothetical protein RJ639_022610 [Escallonia herrerae]